MGKQLYIWGMLFGATLLTASGGWSSDEDGADREVAGILNVAQVPPRAPVLRPILPAELPAVDRLVLDAQPQQAGRGSPRPSPCGRSLKSRQNTRTP